MGAAVPLEREKPKRDAAEEGARPFATHFAEEAEEVTLPHDKKVSPIYGDTTTVYATGTKGGDRKTDPHLD